MRALIFLLLFSCSPVVGQSLFHSQAFLSNAGAGRSSSSSYTAYASKFDSNDYLSRTNTLSGASSSKWQTISLWVKFETLTWGAWFFNACDSEGTVKFRVGQLTTSGFILQHVSGAYWWGVGGAVATNTWYHIIASTKNESESSCKMYVNDVDVGAPTGVSNNTIPWGDYNGFYLGALRDGTSKMNASVCEFWWAPGQFIDLSLADNRNKFALSSKPIDLGADGSTPTGTAPAIYLKNAYGSFQTDVSGNGNSFTVTGSLESATAP